jgi:hypothetical protein
LQDLWRISRGQSTISLTPLHSTELLGNVIHSTTVITPSILKQKARIDLCGIQDDALTVNFSYNINNLFMAANRKFNH